MQTKFGEIRKVLWLILFLNMIVAIAKIVMGSIIKSASMIADGAHSITDGSSNVIGIIGISLAAVPKDKEHPYGHTKIETLTGLFIVAMLGYLGLKIMIEAIPRFSNPVRPSVNVESLVVMVATFFINLFVAKFEHKKGTQLKSTILIADALHTKSDLFVTVGVIVTLIALKLGAPTMIDPIASLVVAGFILKAAYEIFKGASGILIDRIVVDEMTIKEIAMKQSEVKDVHNIRSRGTLDDLHIDMHVLADPDLPLMNAHQLSHNIERAIRAELKCNLDVIVHLEPFVEGYENDED